MTDPTARSNAAAALRAAIRLAWTVDSTTAERAEEGLEWMLGRVADLEREAEAARIHRDEMRVQMRYGRTER
jgi:hypothetical protein